MCWPSFAQMLGLNLQLLIPSSIGHCAILQQLQDADFGMKKGSILQVELYQRRMHIPKMHVP